MTATNQAQWLADTFGGAGVFIEKGIRIVLIVVLLAVALKLLGKLSERLLASREGALDHRQIKKARTISVVVRAIIKYVLIVVAAAMILGELGLSRAMDSLLATVGIGGLALGIGAQNVFKDVLGGVSLLFSNQFIVGDYVQIGGVSGTVQTITLRTTHLLGMQGELVVIANGSISQVVNLSRGAYFTVVDVPAALDADLAALKSRLQEAARTRLAREEDVMELPCVLGVHEVTPFAVVIRVGMKVRARNAAVVERVLREELYCCLRQAGALPAACPRRGE